MLILAGFLFVVGAILGLRYKVAILVPATGAALIFAVADSVIQDRRIGSSVLSIFLTLACLQFGYLLGSSMLSLWPRSRVSGKDRDASTLDSRRLAH